MIYRPTTGSMWDPSVIFHDGIYYAFMMYNRDGPINSPPGPGHCFLASSIDGVHWDDEGIIIEERERESGSRFFKCFVSLCGQSFIMDHGVNRREGQDTLRFYEAKDLRHWEYLSSNYPDPRWYTRDRWDHMYILPKKECTPTAGYWGYPVAQALSDLPRGVGMMESPDGRTWEALPPARVIWDDIPPCDFEWGGCERIGEKYYLIGGGRGPVSDGYSMYVFWAHDPQGPFRPDEEAYRLCGSTKEDISWLAAWCRGKDELLISNYASIERGSRSPWMLPLRMPVLDEKGHLRLGWWSDNERLKGVEIPVCNTSITLDSGEYEYDMLWLDQTFDLQRGVILEGNIKATSVSTGTDCAAGLILDEGNSQSMAVQLGIGVQGERETHIGILRKESSDNLEFKSEDVTGKGCATVTGIEKGKEHAFRLLARFKGFELYIDDLLMQTYTYQPIGGRFGFLVRNAEAMFDDLSAWGMSLA
jgi:hypothetical protein